MKHILILLVFCFSLLGQAGAQISSKLVPQKIKPIAHYYTDVDEPSDIVLNQAGTGFWMVSDDGLLFETNLEGKIIRQAPFTGFDFEAVWADNQFVYAVDERTRKIHFYNPESLVKVKSIEVPYLASRNKGYESFCFNAAKGKFILITEKDPALLVELDAQWKWENDIPIKGLRDVSAFTFYNNKLYILSDEDREIWVLDPSTYQVEAKYLIPIINPEGICFDREGNLFITSDDRQVLYKFSPLTQQ